MKMDRLLFLRILVATRDAGDAYPDHLHRQRHEALKALVTDEHPLSHIVEHVHLVSEAGFVEETRDVRGDADFNALPKRLTYAGQVHLNENERELRDPPAGTGTSHHLGV